MLHQKDQVPPHNQNTANARSRKHTVLFLVLLVLVLLSNPSFWKNLSSCTYSQQRKQQEPTQLQNLHSIDNQNDNSSCVSSSLEYSTQQWYDQWQLEHVEAVQNIFRSQRMGKSWKLVDRFGTVAYAKSLGIWGSTDPAQEDSYGIMALATKKNENIFHNRSAVAKFKCAFWKDLTNWKGTNYGASSDEVLAELYVHHVDRALGFDTVPPGKLVAIGPSIWAEFFSLFVCAPPSIVRRHINELQTQHGPLRLLAWVQQAWGITGNPKKKNRGYNGNWDPKENKCGEDESNVSQPIFLDKTDAASTLNYYKYTLTLRLVRKWDTTSNCFFIPSQKCPSDKDPNAILALRPVNVDNDRIYKPGNPALRASWKNPCFVPSRLREHMLNITNLTHAVLTSVGRHDEQFLGTLDMEWIHGQLVHAEKAFVDIQNQFRDCNE